MQVTVRLPQELVHWLDRLTRETHMPADQVLLQQLQLAYEAWKASGGQDGPSS